MIGRRLGHYRVTASIGAGGMGEVYRAHDEQLRRDVAIKILLRGVYDDDASKRRLEREARAAAALNHPHICTIHEVGEHDGRGYIVMEWLEGEPLNSLLQAGRLPIDDVQRFALQLADALAHAHERGVIHRDLKPGNIIVDSAQRVKILDFGLAKRESESAGPDGVTATMPGQIAGTPAYLAPEQLRGLPADARSDIWSLGLVLYEMSTGRRAFDEKTWPELNAAILTKPVPPLPAYVPPSIASVIARCLEKDPNRRFQTAAELRAALEAAGQPIARRQPAKFFVAAAIVIAIAFAAWIVRSIPFGTSRRPIRVAVLPFANLTGDPNQEYFSDGLTDEMIAQMSMLGPEHVNVIARTSAMHYKKTTKSVVDIGKELNLDYVLEGSARRERDRVRISTDLVRVSDETQLWSEVFESDVGGLLNVQRDVARKVADALAIKLLPADAKRLATRATVDSEAYENYLRGLQSVYKLGRDELQTARGYFEAALQKDPQFAQAWAGMAMVHGAEQQMGFVPYSIASPKIRAATLKALELDPSSSEAHVRLAVLKVWTDWDYAAGELEYQRAIQLNPNNAIARMSHAHLLMIMHRPADALKESARAVDLDPFNPLVRAFRGVVLANTRPLDEAIAEFRTSLQISPTIPFAQNGLINALVRKGAEAEALEEAKRFGNAEEKPLLESASGPRDAWLAVARKLGASKQPREYRIALMYARAADADHAIEWLEKACDEHDPNIPYLGVAGIWDPMRNDPRFQRLLQRANLTQF